MNIKKLRECHFGWGLGGAKSETHSPKNKKLPKLETHSQKTRNYPIKINKKHRSIYSYNIQIYASSQSRLTQALYQTRYEQYFETLKFKKKSPQIRNPLTNNMLLPHTITINKKLPNKITILRT